MTPNPAFFFTHAATDGNESITVYAPGRDALSAQSESHGNFSQIKALCLASLKGEAVDPDEVADLFNIGRAIERKFQRLTERVSVVGDSILLDGDPVNGSLQDQILAFLDAGEDFGPLVNFYEKLVTNPLGDVREGLFDWIVGQTANGTLTITPDGDVIGYKSVKATTPEWRTDAETVYVPSRRGEGTVNGIDVPSDRYIEQIAGDVVEMPRSKVLHAPSQECGTGLHIGTWEYAHGFRTGGCGDVMLVKFSPRDIVSLPDSNASWKLRVCRYTVVGPCDEPLDTPLYLTESDVAEAEAEAADQGLDLDLSLGLAEGDRVVDYEGDAGTVVASEDGEGIALKYDREAEIGGPLVVSLDGDEADGDDPFIVKVDRSGRIHGKGGATSQAAKGRGLNKAQNPATGRFENGRPGSERDDKTGRFVAQG